MTKRKTKTTRMIERLITATEHNALKGSHDPDTWEDIDFEFYMARLGIQYYVETMEKRVKHLEKLIKSTLGSGALDNDKDPQA